MSDDDISVTSSVVSEVQDEYILEKILAERTTPDGLQWLVQWEGYPEERSTWEPRSSFTTGDPLFEWQAQKMRISRGYDKPYDVAAFEKRVSAIENSRAIRKAKRRAKRSRLGLPVSTDSDEPYSSDEAEESDDETPLDRPSVSRRGSLRNVSRLLDDIVIEDDEIVRKESPKKAKANKTPRSRTSDSETGDHLSDDSLVEDLKAKEIDKVHQRLKKKQKAWGESSIIQSPEPALRQIPHVGTARMLSPPSRQMPPTGTNRVQSSSSRQLPPGGTDRKKSQPSSKVPSAGVEGQRKKSLPTPAPAQYSGTMNREPAQRKGAVGTGPKRYVKKQPKYQGKPKVQGAAIMGRWDASVKPRKRTTVVPGLVPSSNAKTFGKLSIKRKFEKAGRNEPAPNPENLVFINPKKDKAVPKPITMPKRNTLPVQTAWEIYRERLKNEISDLGNGKSSSAPEPEVGEGVLMDVDWGGNLDVTSAAAQTSPGVTEQKQSTELVRSISPTQASGQQLQEAPLATKASKNKAGSLQEQTPNSVTDTSRKSSVSLHSEHPGDVSVHKRHDDWDIKDDGFSRPGPRSEVSVPSGSKFTYEPGSDPNLKPLLAMIRVGDEGHKVGTVKLKGLDRYHSGMLLRTKNEGKLEVWCKVSCTASNYRRYLHEGSGSFVAGTIEPFPVAASPIGAMAATLNAHASGGLYLQNYFALLIYPAGTADWAFLNPEYQASPKQCLQFIMRSPLLHPYQDLPQDPLQHQLDTTPMSLPDEPKITTVFRHLFKIDYKTLISQNARKTKIANTFFLMFSRSCIEEHELIIKFLEANGATIYSSYTPGSWNYFTSHVDAGVIIIHPTFYAYHLIPSLPAILKKNINVFSIGTSVEPTLDLSSSPPYRITYTSRFACERLFPHGGAVLVTESVFLDDPKAARNILQWFKEALIKRAAGTWKLICRPGIKERMAELVDEVPEDRAIYTELYALLTAISPFSAPDSAEHDHESENTLVTPSALLETYNSHPTPTLRAAYLVEWFAGWANCHVHAFRRFQVVHPVVVERWGERWRTLELLTPEDFAATYKLSENGSGSGGGAGNGGGRRKSVGS